MESEAVRRRVHMIAAHFASRDDVSPTHLLPMNCSGSLNSVLRRCDNKIYFARQASASLGPFMRQTSLEQGSFSLTSSDAPKPCGVSSESACNVKEPCFARPARTESNSQGSLASSVTPKSCGVASETPCNVREPCFARPARTESNLSNVSMAQPLAQGYDVLAPNPPSFARPGRQTARGDQPHSEKKMSCSEVNKIEWSPRMDVAESEGKYVMTVEVPGVSIKDIRVEVDDQKLSVKGTRSTRFWSVKGYPDVSFFSYHRREILYGPYEVVWPLPTGVNKDSISAEFLDGFLQIIIPKL